MNYTETLRKAEKLCVQAVRRKREWRSTRLALRGLCPHDMHFGASSSNESALRIVREALRAEMRRGYHG